MYLCYLVKLFGVYVYIVYIIIMFNFHFGLCIYIFMVASLCFLFFSQMEKITIQDIDLGSLGSKECSAAVFSMPKLQSIEFNNAKLDHQFFSGMAELAKTSQVDILHSFECAESYISHSQFSTFIWFAILMCSVNSF